MNNNRRPNPECGHFTPAGFAEDRRPTTDDKVIDMRLRSGYNHSCTQALSR